jgi:hypothetical protein
MYRILSVLLILVAQAIPAAAAQEPVRLALLIGNKSYTGKVQPLKNPHNDIEEVGKALAAVGFKVTRLPDASRLQMLGAVNRLGADLARGGPSAVGFLYYSGHGVARPEDRTNYLIPIDLQDTSSTDFWYAAVKLDDIMGELERAAPFAAHFVVVDACREDLQLPYRSASKGFVPVAERSGMFIAFATASGAVALDQVRAEDATGPYSSVLAKELVKPGQDHLQLFQNVKEGVFAATASRQTPWERNGLLRRVVFAKASSSPQPPVTTTSAPPAAPSRAEVAQFCREVATNPSVAVVQALLEAYEGTPMAACAKARLDELKLMVAPPSPKPAPMKASQPPAATAALPQQSTDPQWHSAAKKEWASLDRNNVAALEAFVRKYEGLAELEYEIEFAKSLVRHRTQSKPVETSGPISNTVASGSPANPTVPATPSAAQREWSGLNKKSVGALEAFIRKYDGKGEADYEVEYARSQVRLLRSGRKRAE